MLQTISHQLYIIDVEKCFFVHTTHHITHCLSLACIYNIVPQTRLNSRDKRP